MIERETHGLFQKMSLIFVFSLSSQANWSRKQFFFFLRNSIRWWPAGYWRFVESIFLLPLPTLGGSRPTTTGLRPTTIHWPTPLLVKWREVLGGRVQVRGSMLTLEPWVDKDFVMGLGLVVFPLKCLQMEDWVYVFQGHSVYGHRYRLWRYNLGWSRHARVLARTEKTPKLMYIYFFLIGTSGVLSRDYRLPPGPFPRAVLKL